MNMLYHFIIRITISLFHHMYAHCFIVSHRYIEKIIKRIDNTIQQFNIIGFDDSSQRFYNYICVSTYIIVVSHH